MTIEELEQRLDVLEGLFRELLEETRGLAQRAVRVLDNNQKINDRSATVLQMLMNDNQRVTQLIDAFERRLLDRA